MKQNPVKNNVVRALILGGLLLIASGLNYEMVLFSALRRIGLMLDQYLGWLVVNVIFVLSGILILYAIIGRAWVSVIISSVLSLIWSFADYFTVIYHGSPLFPNEFANFKTAMEVAGGYSFAIDADLVKVICAFVMAIAVAFVLRVVEKEDPEIFRAKRLRRCITSLIAGVAGIAMMLFAVLGPIEFKPENTMSWSWQDGVKKYGYWVCSVESMHNVILEPYKVPDGYSAEGLSGVGDSKPAEATEYPDIIVILNETFYDLDKFYVVDPDVSPLEKFYSLDNAVYGFVPSGGGTNDSEYELLMSNSLFLLKNTSPFNFVDLKDRFSAVKYAQSLGYTTTAMHCGEASNYHRNKAYKDMEFDRIFLGEDAFKYHENNYKRRWLDSENYKDMMEQLDDNSPEPQLMFLLTYQNHSGYGKNDDSLDTVHTGVDYAEGTSEINEYMTSVELSSNAFYDLIQKLKDRRPTVVIMVGDHGPTVKRYLTPRETEFDVDLAASLVPYVIWTNYKEVPEKYGDLASMEALIPMTFDVAGLPIAPYYNKILELHEIVPVRSVGGMYIDSNGKEGKYSEDSEYHDILNEYYCMEYNTLGDKSETIKELFWP